jgi:uncharacterized membrane protein
MILFGIGIVVDSILAVYYAMRVLSPITGLEVIQGESANAPELEAGG